MKIYEYIFAAVIMVVILITAVFLTGISPHMYRSISEVEQLKMAAQKIMAQLLLSPGDPEDWGENIAVSELNIRSLGLAVSTIFTRDVFVLDQDKVQRLSPEMPSQLYISPRKALDLLNLGSDYGIKIEFIPALDIDISVSGSKAIIKVLSEQRMPASHVSIAAMAFSVEGGKITPWVEKAFDNDGDGACILDFPFDPDLLIVIADYFGVAVSQIYVSPLTYTSYLVGKFIISAQPIIAGNGVQVFAVRLPDGTLTLASVKCELNQWLNPPISNYNVYNISFIEPNLIAVVSLSGNGLMVSYKIVPGVYSSIPGEVYPPLAYMLERSVRIGLSTYTFRLLIWRMVW